MARAFPHLGVHDDARVQTDHLVGCGSARRNECFVVGGDHVAPPCFADVPLELDAHRPIVPKPVEPSVDLARLKEETTTFAQGDQLIHFHGEETLPG